ncbi:MAG TPA: hypothetical protein VGR70_01840 [Stellaceae bacterium]|nr:hypothetical protein [Stellaceae bacterium]
MKLQDYLAQQQLKMAPFGRRCGVNDRSVFRLYVLGKVMPPRRVVVAIYIATCGQVAPADWFELPPLEFPLEEAA